MLEVIQLGKPTFPTITIKNYIRGNLEGHLITHNLFEVDNVSSITKVIKLARNRRTQPKSSNSLIGFSTSWNSKVCRTPITCIVVLS